MTLPSISPCVRRSPTCRLGVGFRNSGPSARAALVRSNPGSDATRETRQETGRTGMIGSGCRSAGSTRPGSCMPSRPSWFVTTADSAVLIVNTINAAGDEGPKARPHIYFWGAALGAVVAALLLVGGLKAIQTAMVIGALPFSVVMVLQCVAIVKAIYNDGRREQAGMKTTFAPDAAE